MMMALVAEADRQSPRRRRRRRRRCVYRGALAPSPLNRSAQTPSHHRTVTDKLQRVLNERVITGTRKFNTYGRRAFSVAGSMAWNSLSRILSGIQRAAQTVLGVYLKRTCSRVTSAFSAIAVLNDYALYKSTHALTHSLTLTHFHLLLICCTTKC